MGTFGTGPVSSDGALDLLDELTGQPAGQRRDALKRIFFQVRDRPDLLGRKFFPDEIVAAAAVVAASLADGEDIRRDLGDWGYDVDAILVRHRIRNSALVPWKRCWLQPGETVLGMMAGSTRRPRPRLGKLPTGSRRPCGARSTRRIS